MSRSERGHSSSDDHDESTTPEFNFDNSFQPASGTSIRYQVYYAAGSNEWWSEYYNTNLQRWVRLLPVSSLHVTAMTEVFAAAESTHFSFSSGTIRYTDAKAQLVGGSLTGFCWDPGVYQRMLYKAGKGACSTEGTSPFTWDVYYVKP